MKKSKLVSKVAGVLLSGAMTVSSVFGLAQVGENKTTEKPVKGENAYVEVVSPEEVTEAVKYVEEITAQKEEKKEEFKNEVSAKVEESTKQNNGEEDIYKALFTMAFSEYENLDDVKNVWGLYEGMQNYIQTSMKNGSMTREKGIKLLDEINYGKDCILETIIKTSTENTFDRYDNMKYTITAGTRKDIAVENKDGKNAYYSDIQDYGIFASIYEDGKMKEYSSYIKTENDKDYYNEHESLDYFKMSDNFKESAYFITASAKGYDFDMETGTVKVALDDEYGNPTLVDVVLTYDLEVQEMILKTEDGKIITSFHVDPITAKEYMEIYNKIKKVVESGKEKVAQEDNSSEASASSME